jgi:hypothetical protein
VSCLVGFKARNHPQQRRRRGSVDTVDERITPQWLFDQLHEEHRFTLDAAANATNAKLPRFRDRTRSGLAPFAWAGERVFCNPPFSMLPEFVQLARLVTVIGSCPKAVLLLPANRTEQPWWQIHVEPWRDRGLGVSTRFLPKRINFARPGNLTGKYKTSAPFGCVVVVFEARPPG